MVSCVLRIAQSRGVPVELTAKAWDLADAYKQIPLSDEAFKMDAYVAVYNPSKGGPDV